MTDPRPSLAERSRWPPVLDPADLAVALGFPSPRAAKAFVAKHAVPRCKVGGRIFVLRDSLIAFLRDHEERPETPEKRKARVDEVVRQIAPTARQRPKRRRPPTRKERED